MDVRHIDPGSPDRYAAGRALDAAAFDRALRHIDPGSHDR